MTLMTYLKGGLRVPCYDLIETFISFESLIKH